MSFTPISALIHFLLNSLNLIISSVNETESNLQAGGTFSVNNNQTTTCGSGTFSVQTGDVSIQAANTNNPNVPASDVVIAAGSGTNKIGGSGGDVFVLAGNAAGGEFYSLVCYA